MSIKLVLGGPRGQMGREAIKMINEEEKFTLVACIDRKNDTEAKNEIESLVGGSIKVYDHAETCFTEVDADVYIDLTIPRVGFEYTKTALKHNLYAVVGTSGFSEQQISELEELSIQQKRGCIIAPNFALGSILMMLFSKMAAKYFPDVEIIEKHHDNKVDSPSGTAVKTVEMIQEQRKKKQQGHPEEYEILKGARGAEVDGMIIHSMRLPGLVAHQEVIFGSNSQLLTLKHDTFHREAYMDGLKLAINEVIQRDKLIYGLEHVMDL